MADADEDDLATVSRPPTNLDNDNEDAESDEDGTVDYRFLTRTTTSALPKRGTKDFEPNPTRAQSSALDASREAMHNALSTVRVHPGGKNHTIGIYIAERERARDDRFSLQFDGEEAGSRCVVVYKWRSAHAKAMGRTDRRGWTWFNAEEALYLLERGGLDIRWGDEEGLDQESTEQVRQAQAERRGDEENDADAKAEDVPEPPELPMSLQGAYATLVGRDGLTLERHLVYSGLKRAGYIVQRAPTWYDEQHGHSNGHTPSAESSISTITTTTPLLPAQFTSNSTTLIQRLVSWLINPRKQPPCPSLGPLVAPGLYRNYNDIFRSLSLIPSYQSSPSPPEPAATHPKPPFTIAFHVWKPTPNYRKSAPPPPNYHICVVDARTTTIPTLPQIGDLLDSMPPSSFERDGGKDKRIEGKIKHGKRSVIVAVVDSGVVSYLRFAEAESGSYKLFEDKTARSAGGKGGGGIRRDGGGGNRGKAGRGRGGKR